MREVEGVADLEAVQSCLDIAGERWVHVCLFAVKFVQSLDLLVFVIDSLIFVCQAQGLSLRFNSIFRMYVASTVGVASTTKMRLEVKSPVREEFRSLADLLVGHFHIKSSTIKMT